MRNVGWVNFDKWNFLSQLRSWDFIALKNVDYIDWCHKRTMKDCEAPSDGYEFEILLTGGTLDRAECLGNASVVSRTFVSRKAYYNDACCQLLMLLCIKDLLARYQTQCAEHPHGTDVGAMH